MTLAEFNSLSKDLKIHTIKHKGCFLYVRNEASIDIVLYQLDNFYAEVFFEAGGEGKDDRILIRAFDDTASLDIYLQKINISELVELL